ncbi:hypothetical protein [uncultured Peptoniphilus sp.]|uniref:hypothetical protein n=1 Tax=uncultured Peptoniphilus sp. TaxID=254354 RepID=UPI0025D02964|nr:hypothetical protein [uncultured Peptoniphilus sp.]
MTSKNWQKVLYIFSIVILVLSTLFFLYSLANKKFSNKLILENKKLNSEIQALEDKSKLLDKEIDNLDIEFNLKSQEFYEKYGYQFEANKTDEIKNIKKDYEEKNKTIKSEVREKLRAYSAFFNSNIYEKENYDRSVDDFLSLSRDRSLEKSKNLYKDLDLDSLFKDVDGFASYLINQNKPTNDLNLFVFYASVYSSSIYSFINDEKVSLSEVYVDLNNLLNIYREMERKSYNTGDLSAEKLGYLKDFVDEKVSEYYKNYGIIKALEKSGKDE